jgi:chromosome segregation ATPase
MDVLKQLETKLQGLVQQRNQYRDELAALKADAGSNDEELRNLRRRLEDLQADQAGWQKERDGVRKQVESILKMVEGIE